MYDLAHKRKRWARFNYVVFLAISVRLEAREDGRTKPSLCTEGPSPKKYSGGVSPRFSLAEGSSVHKLNLAT